MRVDISGMRIEKLEGTSPRLYHLVAPLIMRRSVLRQNNNYPFWTSRSHVWFVAVDADSVSGFVPVEHAENGSVKINNYFVSGDDASLLAQLLREIVRSYAADHAIRAVVHNRHTAVFRTEGFVSTKDWKLYVKMEYAG